MGNFYIGISGWRYAPWRNNFYPKGLNQKKELYFASRSVNSIEINGSFYALQTPDRYANWYSDTPEEFVFSVKAHRYITHIRRLNDVEEPIANFFASGLLELKEKLGPILWQFPPTFKFNEEQFEIFLSILPVSFEDAIRLIKKYHPDFKFSATQFLPKKLRHSVEIRNESFVDERFIELLRKYRIAYVIADTAGRWPFAEDITSNFVYIRLHGDTELYNSGYSAHALEHWHKRLKSWSKGIQPKDAKLIGKRSKTAESLDIYCYFDNTDKLWAPKDARTLLTLLGQEKKLRDSSDLLDAIAS